MSYQAGEKFAGKYQLIEQVGGGAMGQVFKAEHLMMNSIVAIKILHPEISGNAEMLERFKREAQSAAAITHSNICKVMDFAVLENGDFYLVMEFLEGDTLQKKIRNEGKIAPEKAVFIMKQLLSVLQCAHDHGIVHRDVKPENIALVFQDETEDFVKLLDFGIAHQENFGSLEKAAKAAEGEFRTQAGFLYGTPEYIAPEQAEGGEIDYRVDLYACGIILYEMLTGHVPFRSKSLVELLHSQVFDPMPHIDIENISHGEELDKIIQKLTEKSRDARYDSAFSVIEALSAIHFDSAGSVAADEKEKSAENKKEDEPPEMVKKAITLVEIGVTHLSGTSFGARLVDYVRNMPRWRRRLIVTGFIVFLCLVLLVVLLRDDTLEEVDISENAVPVKLAEISDVQKFQYEDEFSLSNDETLRRDPNLLKAFEAYYMRDFQLCYDHINAVESRYKKHPNYYLFRIQTIGKLLDSREVSKNAKRKEALVDELIMRFAELTEMIPDSARNAAVRKAIYMAFPDVKKANVEYVTERFQAYATDDLASNLVWAIVYSPYDADEYRKQNMLKVYDSLNRKSVADWQVYMTDAWRLEKEKCTERKDLVEKALETKASKEELYYGVVLPLYQGLRLNVKDKSKRYQCKAKMLQGRDCNDCMQEWIESTYAEWDKP